VFYSHSYQSIYHSSPELLATIQSSWNTQPYAIEDWGTAYELRPRLFPIFVVNSLLLWSNSAPLWVTLFLLRTFLTLSQLCHGPVVIYCMVYHYTKRAALARLLANEGPAIYVVHFEQVFCYTSMILFSSYFSVTDTLLYSLSQKVTYCLWLGWRYIQKGLISKVQIVTKDVVKSEV